MNLSLVGAIVIGSIFLNKSTVDIVILKSLHFKIVVGGRIYPQNKIGVTRLDHSLTSSQIFLFFLGGVLARGCPCEPD